MEILCFIIYYNGLQKCYSSTIIGNSKQEIPPIGAAKLLDTPRAQAQASMSTFLASFT